MAGKTDLIADAALRYPGHVHNPTAIEIHPVKFENRLPIEGKGKR